MKACSAILLCMLVAGCATTPTIAPSSLQDTVYATHRIVRDLDKNLAGSVNQLQTTTADLGVRLDEADRQSKILQNMVEDNQYKIGVLQASLDQLTATLYSHFNLTPPSSVSMMSRPERDNGDVAVRDTVITPAPPRETSEPSEEQPELLAFQPTEETPSEDAPKETAPAASSTSSREDMRESFNGALRAFKDKRYTEAIEGFNDYLRRYPDTAYCAEAQCYKAESYYLTDQYEDAVREYEKMEKKYPVDKLIPRALRYRASACENLGRRDEAIELFERLLKDYPGVDAAQGVKEHLAQLKGRRG